MPKTRMYEFLGKYGTSVLIPADSFEEATEELKQITMSLDGWVFVKDEEIEKNEEVSE